MRAEHRLQSRVRMFMDAGFPKPGEWTSIDKGVRLSGTPQQRMAQAAAMKARGIKNGVHDVLVMYLGRLIWIELKVGRNSTSDSQNDWTAAVRANGFIAEEARSVVEVHDILVRHGIPIAPSMRLAAMHHDAALSVPEAPRKARASKSSAAKPSSKALAFARAAHGMGP